MDDSDICKHVGGVEAALPESAVSARLALSIIFGEIARLQMELARLERELSLRPRVVLVASNELLPAQTSADVPATLVPRSQ